MQRIYWQKEMWKYGYDEENKNPNVKTKRKQDNEGTKNTTINNTESWGGGARWEKVNRQET